VPSARTASEVPRVTRREYRQPPATGTIATAPETSWVEAAHGNSVVGAKAAGGAGSILRTRRGSVARHSHRRASCFASAMNARDACVICRICLADPGAVH
jgi:hypothetical protein